jgi:hypothetical protein
MNNGGQVRRSGHTAKRSLPASRVSSLTRVITSGHALAAVVPRSPPASLVRAVWLSMITPCEIAVLSAS